YLWHWPLLSYAWILYGEKAPDIMLFGLLLLAVLLSTLSYHCIEKPVRRKTELRSVIAIVGVATVVIGLSSNIYSRDGLNFRLKDAQAATEARALEWNDSMRASESCKVRVVEGVELRCLIADPQRLANAVIIGDSHANHYYWGMSDVLAKQGINLMQLARGGCSPLYGVASQKGPKTIDCNNFIDPVIEYLARSPDIHTVFLGGRWMAYITGRELKDPLGYVSDEYLVFSGDSKASDLSRAEIFTQGLDR